MYLKKWIQTWVLVIIFSKRKLLIYVAKRKIQFVSTTLTAAFMQKQEAHAADSDLGPDV